MRAGTRLVLGFVLLAAGALALFRLYGDRVVRERAVQTPLAAARQAAQVDNTVVARLGAIQGATLVDLRPATSAEEVSLAAEVTGTRGRATLYADLSRDGRRWRVLRSRLVTDGGEVLLREGEPPRLAPPDPRPE